LAVLVPLVVANWFSTIYLRYHYLIDVIAGWLVAAVAIVLAERLLRWEARKQASFLSSDVESARPN